MGKAIGKANRIVVSGVGIVVKPLTHVKFNNHICAKRGVFFCTGAYLFSSSVEFEGPYLDKNEGGGKEKKKLVRVVSLPLICFHALMTPSEIS